MAEARSLLEDDAWAAAPTRQAFARWALRLPRVGSPRDVPEPANSIVAGALPAGIAARIHKMGKLGFVVAVAALTWHRPAQVPLGAYRSRLPELISLYRCVPETRSRFRRNLMDAMAMDLTHAAVRDFLLDEAQIEGEAEDTRSLARRAFEILAASEEFASVIPQEVISSRLSDSDPRRRVSAACVLLRRDPAAPQAIATLRGVLASGDMRGLRACLDAVSRLGFLPSELSEPFA
ncbi:MAG: hypothetical protein KAI66_28145, partial [Lentisphaeria bacterium]|nr:hypothetical protein [Lentisphaeria bacterium]